MVNDNVTAERDYAVGVRKVAPCHGGGARVIGLQRTDNNRCANWTFRHDKLRCFPKQNEDHSASRSREDRVVPGKSITITTSARM